MNKKATVSFLLIIFLVLAFINCKKSSACNWAAEPPAPIFFQIKKNGQVITDSTFLSSMKLSYYQNNNKYYLEKCGLLNGTDSTYNISYTNRGIMYANIASVNNDSKTYYIEYPSTFSNQHTLYAYYLTPSASTNCEYKINNLNFDKKAPDINSGEFPFSIYIFEKP